MSAITIPFLFTQFFDDDGNPLASGSIQVYLAGTTTPTPMYTTNALNPSFVFANPAPLNSAGRLAGPAYLDPAHSYKFILYDANSVQVGATYDNITPGATV